MGVKEWLPLVLSTLALVIQGLWTLAVFMWSRSGTADHLASEIRTLQADVTRCNDALERARRHSSEQEGHNTEVFGQFQIEQAILKEQMKYSEQERRELWAAIRLGRLPI